jgi:uncharacterized protein
MFLIRWGFKKEMNREEILKTLKFIKQEAQDQYKAELKGIFGSCARGEQIHESDVDVLVEFLPGATLFNLSGLGNFLEEKLNSKVDILSHRALRKETKPYIYNDLIML